MIPEAATEIVYEYYKTGEVTEPRLKQLAVEGWEYVGPVKTRDGLNTGVLRFRRSVLDTASLEREAVEAETLAREMHEEIEAAAQQSAEDLAYAAELLAAHSGATMAEAIKVLEQLVKTGRSETF